MRRARAVAYPRLPTSRWTLSGALNGWTVNAGAITRSGGIIYRIDSKAEVTYNGKKIVEYELGSADWAAKVKLSKLAAWPGYGKATAGYIGLQQQGARVWYRNIRIKELP